MINYYNLTEQYEDCRLAILGGMDNVYRSGQFYSGEAHDLLEKYIKTHYNDAEVVLTNSGTSALQAALMALYIKPGTRVLLPALTYAATAQAVIAVGGIPTFVDIDSSWLVDIDLLDDAYKKYGDQISALVTVDLYGQGVELDKVRRWCNKHDVKWIIDAAHSFGICSDQYDQTIADAICLSFNPLKNFGGSGGGALISKSIHSTIMQAVCTVGKTTTGSNGNIELHGLNFRMLSTQAATLVYKIYYYAEMIPKKMAICQLYYNHFRNYPDKVDLPIRKPWGTWNYYSFSIAPQRQENVKSALKEANIQYSSHYAKALNREDFVKSYGYQPCPTAENITNNQRVISLPSHWHLSDADVNVIIKTVMDSL